ncbi:MAG: CBS domain-containing protein [Desulfobacterales bacterium]
MLVMNWMSQPAITIDADDYAQDAVRLTNQHDIHMLPVMQNGQLVGIVTDQDIKRAPASDVYSANKEEDSHLLSDIIVKKIMTPNPVTVL